MTFHCRGMTSSVSVMSSPSLDSRAPPQQAQAVGPGTKKAAMAVAHKILVAIFHMLQRGTAFADLGGNYLDALNKHRTAKHLVRRLSLLGYEVMLRPQAAAQPS